VCPNAPRYSLSLSSDMVHSLWILGLVYYHKDLHQFFMHRTKHSSTEGTHFEKHNANLCGCFDFQNAHFHSFSPRIMGNKLKGRAKPKLKVEWIQKWFLYVRSNFISHIRYKINCHWRIPRHKRGLGTRKEHSIKEEQYRWVHVKKHMHALFEVEQVACTPPWI